MAYLGGYVSRFQPTIPMSPACHQDHRSTFPNATVTVPEFSKRRGKKMMNDGVYAPSVRLCASMFRGYILFPCFHIPLSQCRSAWERSIKNGVTLKNSVARKSHNT